MLAHQGASVHPVFTACAAAISTPCVKPHVLRCTLSPLAQEPNFHATYVQLVDKWGERRMRDTLVQTTVHYIKASVHACCRAGGLLALHYCTCAWMAGSGFQAGSLMRLADTPPSSRGTSPAAAGDAGQRQAEDHHQRAHAAQEPGRLAGQAHAGQQPAGAAGAAGGSACGGAAACGASWVLVCSLPPCQLAAAPSSPPAALPTPLLSAEAPGCEADHPGGVRAGQDAGGAVLCAHAAGARHGLQGAAAAGERLGSLPRWMCWRESWQDGLEALAFKRGLRADAKSHVGYMFTIT